jgi:TatD DNase family protein
VVTFDKSKTLQDVVQRVPLSNLLLETDAPYLAPSPHRGKRNEPSFVIHTAKKVAEIKKVPWEEVAQVTACNTMNLFGIEASGSN